jgi:hypothetical protein
MDAPLPESLGCACIVCASTVSLPQVLDSWILLEDAPGHGLCEDCYLRLAAAAINREIALFLATRPDLALRGRGGQPCG